ncbi:short-chain dehydrogenase reductase family [Phlyctema vagabunda]|uniref:Short-chain dehydrogenase reductase family n=1 Tax=Phlyctema vagabunda TaxID=108571 RepID=A0ABR4P9W5_9HELO
MSQYAWGTEGKTIVSDFSDQVQNRTFLITGPSQGGLGAETALSLAHSSPSQIILLGRSWIKIQPTIDGIHAINPAIITKFFPIELASLKSVRSTAQAVLDDPDIPHIDVIINNAAVMANPYTVTEDGFESQFATNHLSHFLLTNLLLPKVVAAGPKARIVNVSSWGHAFSDIQWDDVGFHAGKTYTPWEGYGQSKTANILFAVELNERLKKNGDIRAFALHPGRIETNLTVHLSVAPEQYTTVMEKWAAIGKPPMGADQSKSLQAGCSTTLRAALDPTLLEQDDIYLHDCQVTTDPVEVSGFALDKESAKKLWTLSEDMVGERFHY